MICITMTFHSNKYLQYPIEQRFWNMVNKNGPTPQHMKHLGPCWLWKGTPSKKRYGYLSIIKNNKKRQIAAHRFSYELHYGPIPDNILVCHHCDFGRCVNPKHLWLGNNQDNMDDMIVKGRGNKLKGEQHWRSKLTDEQVRIIKSYPKYWGSDTELAKRFNISQPTVWGIRSGKRWKHINN